MRPYADRLANIIREGHTALAAAPEDAANG